MVAASSCSTTLISLDTSQQNKKANMDAEIWWAHEIFVSQFLFWPCVDLNEILSDYGSRQCNFKWISVRQTKYNYNVLYGFAPYYKQNLISAIDLLPFYRILFDESLNEILQWEQLDIHIRFWSAKNQEVIIFISRGFHHLVYKEISSHKRLKKNL